METLRWWPSAACLESEHSTWGNWSVFQLQDHTALRHCLSEGCGLGGSSVSQASGESTVWAQAARFTPFACCSLSFRVPCNENFFSLTLYFQEDLQFLQGISLLFSNTLTWITEYPSGQVTEFQSAFFQSLQCCESAAFVRLQALQENWACSFQRLTWYIISYFILLSA